MCGGEPGAGRLTARGRAIAVRYGRHMRWRTLVKRADIADEFTDATG